MAERWQFGLLLGAGAGCLAAALAFLTTYEEYSHHYVERLQVLKPALHAALTAFVFFLAIGLVTGWVLQIALSGGH